MTIKESLAELRESLEELQKRLGEKAAEFAADERVPSEQRARVETMEKQARAVKEKLPEEEGSVWNAVKHEVQRDLNALAQDFDHVIGYIDKHFRETE
ncbi:MAG: hypothetical protein Kow0026_02960 [Oricola sp.]